jgi:hypothetical protein
MFARRAAILWVSGIAMRFVPPTRAQQLAAVGPTGDLPEALRRALEAGEDFESMSYPGPSDWLANHAEPGQTFERFASSRPNRPAAQRKVLYLQPLGNWDCDDGPPLGQLRQFTAAFLRMDAVILFPPDVAQARIASRRNPGTGQAQLLTGDILKSGPYRCHIARAGPRHRYVSPRGHAWRQGHLASDTLAPCCPLRYYCSPRRIPMMS